MTREEILKSNYMKLDGACEDDWQEGSKDEMHQCILTAMSEFAQQEAIAFAEWRFRSGYSPCACTFGVGWLHKDDGQKPFIEAKFYTTTELYSLFKTTQNG